MVAPLPRQLPPPSPHATPMTQRVHFRRYHCRRCRRAVIAADTPAPFPPTHVAHLCTPSAPAAAIAVTAHETHTLSASIAAVVASRYSRRRNRSVSAVLVAAFACMPQNAQVGTAGSVPRQRPVASVQVVSRKVKTLVLRAPEYASGSPTSPQVNQLLPRHSRARSGRTEAQSGSSTQAADAGGQLTTFENIPCDAAQE